MNENEDYFRISKNGNIHTLSDRIPFKWKELIGWTSASFVFLIYFFGFGIGIFIAILTLIGYTSYRFASWIYYTELLINEKTGNMIRLKKLFDRVQKTELITEKLNPNRFEYSELKRSGKTKYLMNYRTHKNNELLILKNKTDKDIIEKYIAEKITVYNTVYN
ncbi:hypothetical protein ESY86_19915 [Subsaximicrobium wynnwilliamsii]|uniref:DUF304 domain-containing protein n=1 Tax=Subsaximicrobium wynnwilliamsii TaxID=291179 RepID=A0A5C6ZC69_9FLAO|nr:hypothetical protein [Subsaximicrobium wynnwilliamsii]TXD80805.1 hypothetical protein ESY87_20085 [Subsaximicrobium wynnwilliamsii]TXD86547.1 hypothetical protein ESY86_19915 [Subsaximicrobium wynnwilliamsii]TXE00093.1 hypothetical protein ESY88_20025 [Subsaximicrobium wynnwilliamsii]